VGTERDGFIIYALALPKIVQKIPLAESDHTIQWSPDGKFLVIGSWHCQEDSSVEV